MRPTRRTSSPPGRRDEESDVPSSLADDSAISSELRWNQVPPRRYAGWAVAASFFIFDVFIRMATGVVTPTLQAEFDVSAAVVSTAFGGVFFYGYGAGQLPAGTLLDRLGPKRTYILGGLLAAMGCFLFAVARSVLVGTVGRALTGVGCAVAWIGCVKVVRLNFGAQGKLSDMMIGVSNTLGSIGGLASQAPMNAMVDSVGWRRSFMLAALAPLCLLVLAMLFIDDLPVKSPVVGPGAGAGRAGTTWQLIGKVVRAPRTWAYGVAIGGFDAPLECMAGLWGAAYLRQALGWSGADAANALTLLVVVCAASQLLLSPLCVMLHRRTWRCLLLLALALIGVAGLLPMLLASVVLQRWVVMVSIVLLGIAFGSTTVTWMLISTDPMCAGATAAGTVSGAANTICMALDAILQTGYGALLDAFWSGEHSGAERVYSPLAYSRALLLYLAALTAAAAAAIYLWHVARREQRASDACSSPCSEVNERQELLLGR